MRTAKNHSKIGAVAILAVAALISIQTPSFAASSAASQLPASVKKSGVLTVGTDTTYAPNEYLDPSGNVIGWDIALFKAIAADLGVKVHFVSAGFDTIIPAVKG